MLAVVDAGPLYAAVDADDDDHARCLEVLQRTDLDLILPALAIAEVTYLVGRRLGATVEARFLEGLASLEVEAPSADDWPRIARLVERYADFPLGGTDASVAVLADRVGTDLILTLDRRHFGAIRSADGRPYRLLPGPES
ncbi:MAG: type II toxin-antitoxin system VapC family toxin [Candidatus Limnocylindrales bacterium]